MHINCVYRTHTRKHKLSRRHIRYRPLYNKLITYWIIWLKVGLFRVKNNKSCASRESILLIWPVKSQHYIQQENPFISSICDRCNFIINIIPYRITFDITVHSKLITTRRHLMVYNIRRPAVIFVEHWIKYILCWVWFFLYSTIVIGKYISLLLLIILYTVLIMSIISWL